MGLQMSQIPHPQPLDSVFTSGRPHYKPEKTDDISRRHERFSREMTSEN